MFLKNHTFKYFKDGKFKVIRENSSSYFIIDKKMLLYYLWDDDPNYDFSTLIPENHGLNVNDYSDLEISDMLIDAIFNYQP